MLKKILSGLTIAGLLAAFVLPQAYAASDEQWEKTPPPTAEPSWGIAMNEDTGAQAPYAELISVKADNYETDLGKVLAVKACKSYKSDECSRDEYQRYTTPLGFCSTDSQSNCVEEVLARGSDGKKLSVKFLRNFPEESTYDFAGDDDFNLPEGATTFLVDIPEAVHAGGTTYLVAAVLNGEKMPTDSKFKTSYFNAQIFAVSLVAGRFNMTQPGLDPALYNGVRNVNRSNGLCGIQCSPTESAVGHALPLDLSFGLRVRLKAEVNGWLNGRVSNIESSISKDAQNRQILELLGKPVIVPVIFGWVAKSAAPQKLLDFYAAMGPERANSGNGYGKCLDPNRAPDVVGPCRALYWESALRNPGKDMDSLSEVALWLPILNDKAVAAPTMWLMSSLGQGFDNNCSATTDRVSGIVTTNATGYVSGPPVFNKEEQTLDYKVIGPHYLPDGKEFKGTYDLTIDADFARCLYGFTKAPIGATVSIVSADGQAQVATVVVSQRDKWIHLGAYGFGFSSPTLKVKFTQDAPAPTATPTPSAKPVVAKKSTITCVKGKTTKKVTALKPKCPTGFKVKK
jgi:hypothetical protein